MIFMSSARAKFEPERQSTGLRIGRGPDAFEWGKGSETIEPESGGLKGRLSRRWQLGWASNGS